ncbi:MAG: NADP-dependent malic enzyme [Candidatus Cloacimonetes bacterium]|nr:NADP-dependent malic enzyme [Candidatus Cloacimonadota bacterium]
MMKISLENIEQLFPEGISEEEKAKVKTLFFKEMAIQMHEFYKGKIQVLPKAGLYGFNWFNVWYTPGVSSVSTAIRDQQDRSFDLSNRGNLVAVVSDSTRVLGDGDCGPSGGLGVMEGKAYLMKYLAGVDGIALCVDNRDENKKPSPDKIIDFVKMLQPSVGAVNLEDISQPDCYKVLDVLRRDCEIPVWHDDAQGTACVILAGLINALILAEKKMEDVKIVLFGAGASNTTVAKLLLLSGANPDNIVLFDSKGGLHKNRKDIKDSPKFYIKWELCQKTNPQCFNHIEDAMKGADVLISLSQPGPDTVKKDWVKSMNEKAIVFTCANPVPEIYPYAAKEAGAFIVATGRGDFPNQVNNSLGFPGILKGALLCKARQITDGMAIRAAESLAEFARQRDFHADKILPTMDELEVFAQVAADVAMQAVKEGVARTKVCFDQVYNTTLYDIKQTRKTIDLMMDNDIIKEPSADIIQDILNKVIKQVVR